MSWLAIFAAGVATYLTPCILPLVPIYLAALAGGNIRDISGLRRGHLFLRALAFAAGFVAVFTALGLAASSVSALLTAHKVWLQLGGGVLILLFGLKFIGVIQVPWLDGVVRGNDQRFSSRFGLLNAFGMGLVFAAGWSPCVGPILGSVLTYTASQTSDPLLGARYLATFGAGLALPLLATAVFAETGLRWLARLRPYLPKIEMATGALLIVAGISLLGDVAGTAPMPVQNDAISSKVVTPAPAPPVLAHSGPTMLEIYSTHCTICQQMAPIVQRVSSECKDDSVQVRQVDISEAQNRSWVEQYRVVGVPTFIFLDGQGMEVARLVGRQSEDALRQSLAALRGESCAGVGPVPPMPAPTTAIVPSAHDHVACSVQDASNPSGTCDAAKF